MIIMVVLFRPHAFASLCKMVCPCTPSKCVYYPARVCMPVDSTFVSPVSACMPVTSFVNPVSACMPVDSAFVRPASVCMPVTTFVRPASVCMPVDSAFARTPSKCRYASDYLCTPSKCMYASWLCLCTPSKCIRQCQVRTSVTPVFSQLNPRRPLKGVNRLVCLDKALSFSIPHVRTGREKTQAYRYPASGYTMV